MADKQENLVNGPRTERWAARDARVIGVADQDHRIQVTVYIRRNPNSGPPPSLKTLETALPKDRKYLSEAEVEAVYGADPADIAKVEAFAKANGLIVLETHLARRSVLLSGTVSQFSAAFGVELKQYETPTGNYRGREGLLRVPAELDGIVEAVFGLDDRPIGSPHARRPKTPRAVPGDGLPDNTYFPPELAQVYNYPSEFNGTGECIGIFVFNDQGGGYSMQALQKYFGQILVPPVPLPQIVNVVVHGQGNDPHFVPPDVQDSPDVSVEVMLDMQVAGSVAPGAKIVMYFTEFTQPGWVDAIKRAVHDTTNNPSVLSISYGNPEDDSQGFFPTEDMVKIISDAFETAKAKGITICVSSGDNGSTDGDPDGNSHVDFPASSPNVLGCGGTKLMSSNGARTSETVWNDDEAGGGVQGASGGGFSTIFPIPDYQQTAGISSPNSMRGVPDVSGLADPATGVQVADVRGNLDKRFPVGGTSATAPLWAALIARLNQGLGARVGFLNQLLYTQFAQGVLFDVTSGDNGAFQAGPGWDPCTGLGSPDGRKLLAALQGGTVAQSTTPVPSQAALQPSA
jgi:kumamolisin